jgi:hypothetical protein
MVLSAIFQCGGNGTYIVNSMMLGLWDSHMNYNRSMICG